MKLADLFVGSMSHLSAKLAPWARMLLGLWILTAGVFYFGWVELPVEDGWLRALILAPAAVALLIVVVQIAAQLVSWITWPFRKAAALLRKAH